MPRAKTTVNNLDDSVLPLLKMTRAKTTVDNPEEDSVLPDFGVSTTFIVPTENGTDVQTMMAPLRRKQPPTIAIVLEAIKSLDEKKGSTYVAIKNWIMANYPEFNRTRFKFMITKALEKGVKESKLQRKSGDAENALTLGRYKIVERKAAVKKDKPITPADDVPAISEKLTKKIPPKKSAKPSKKVVQVESRSDTEAEAKSSQVPIARRRRSVSESATTTAPKIVKNPSKKKATQTKTVAPKSTKATFSANDTAVKKTTTASKKKTASKEN